MKNSLLLRKGVVKEKISQQEFRVEDVIDKEIINMTIPKKYGKKTFIVEIGEIVYAPFDKKRGRITTQTSFKVDNYLYTQKIELDKRHSTLCLEKEE